MATATTMYHSGKNPLRKVTDKSETVFAPKGLKNRRLHKAFLRYHDPANWPLLRDALKRMGRADLIGNGKQHLIPKWQPKTGSTNNAKAPAKGRRFKTQHTRNPSAVIKKRSSRKRSK